jgi:transcription elongation factor GreB
MGTCHIPDSFDARGVLVAVPPQRRPGREIGSRVRRGVLVNRPMTLEGYTAIEAEIDRLWREERPVVVQEVSDAADLGDRSENAAYIYGKKRLRQIDSRMRYLNKKIDEAIPVDLAQMVSHPTVKFGAVVTFENQDGEEKSYRLVDKEESSPERGRISVQSPVGMALLGKKVDDVVTVRVGDRVMELEITALRYGGGEP